MGIPFFQSKNEFKILIERLHLDMLAVDTQLVIWTGHVVNNRLLTLSKPSHFQLESLLVLVKIASIIEATRSNINTNLTVKDIVLIGSTFANIESSKIHVYNIGNNCLTYNNCTI